MRWLKDNLATVVAAAGVAIVLVASFALFGRLGPGSGEAGLVAVVHDADGTAYRLPLSTDDSLTVTTTLGTNTLTVADGAVHMSEADCPKGSCMDQLPISQPGQQIVCLPHRLWVEIVDAQTGNTNEAADSQMDIDAVTWNDVDFVAQ